MNKYRLYSRFLVSAFLILGTLSAAIAQDSLRVNLISRIPMNQHSYRIEYNNGIVYISCQSNIKMIDVRNPQQPIELGMITFDQISDFCLIGQFLVVASRTDTVRLYNVSNPSAPILVDTLARYYYRLVTNRNLIYAYGPFSFCILWVDTTGIGSISQIGSCNLDASGVTDIYSCDSIVYATGVYEVWYEPHSPPTVYHCINKISCRILSAPQVISRVSSSNVMGFQSVAWHQGYVYVGSAYSIHVFQDNLQYRQTITVGPPSFSSVTKITVNNNFLVAACRDDGLKIYDCTQPGNPTLRGYYSNNDIDSCITCDVATHNNLVYAADGNYFSIYDCSQALGVVDRIGENIPTDFTIEQLYPNPFNAAATLTYTLPKQANVKLELFDITGRSVGTVFDWSQEAGTYSVKLQGEQLTSGAYFAKLSAGSQSVSRKFVVLK